MRWQPGEDLIIYLSEKDDAHSVKEVEMMLDKITKVCEEHGFKLLTSSDPSTMRKILIGTLNIIRGNKK